MSDDVREDIERMSNYFDGTIESPTDQPKLKTEEELKRDAEAGLVLGDADADVDNEESLIIEEEEEEETIKPIEDVQKSNELDDVKKELAELKELIKNSVKPQEEKLVETPKDEYINFVTDEDMYNITEDHNKMNDVLNSLYKKSLETAAKRFFQEKENILSTIPDIVAKNVSFALHLKSISDEFYSQNEDLKPFKKVVSTVFDEVAQANPGKSYEKLLIAVSNIARKRLNLRRENKLPNLPTKSTSVRAGNTVKIPNPLAIEIEEMNKSLFI